MQWHATITTQVVCPSGVHVETKPSCLLKGVSMATAKRKANDMAKGLGWTPQERTWRHEDDNHARRYYQGIRGCKFQFTIQRS